MDSEETPSQYMPRVGANVGMKTYRTDPNSKYARAASPPIARRKYSLLHTAAPPGHLSDGPF
jgi:hypothetical protein